MDVHWDKIVGAGWVIDPASAILIIIIKINVKIVFYSVKSLNEP
jgi:hypothetical protein